MNSTVKQKNMFATAEGHEQIVLYSPLYVSQHIYLYIHSNIVLKKNSAYYTVYYS